MLDFNGNIPSGGITTNTNTNGFISWDHASNSIADYTAITGISSQTKRSYRRKPFYAYDCEFTLKTGKVLHLQLMFDKSTNDSLQKGAEYQFSKSFLEMSDQETGILSPQDIADFSKMFFELTRIFNQINFYKANPKSRIKISSLSKSQIQKSTILHFKEI